MDGESVSPASGRGPTPPRASGLAVAGAFGVVAAVGAAAAWSRASAAERSAAADTIDHIGGDTVTVDTIEQQAPESVGEEIPGYRATVEFLRSLEPVEGAFEDTLPETGVGLNLDLVINETSTPTGQDFFDAFYSAWEAPPGVGTYEIRIVEQPVEGLYTRVVLRLDGEQLFQIPLQPRYDYIQRVAEQAAQFVRRRLRQRRSATEPAAEGAAGG